MPNREQALQLIRELSAEHQLTLADISRALEPSTGNEKQSSSILSKVFAYLGGIFVLAGLVVYTGMFWDEFNSAARIVITFGTGFVLFVLAVLATYREGSQGLSTPFFVMAALFLPSGIMVAFHELGSGGDVRVAMLITAALMLGQYSAAFFSLRRTCLIFFSLVFGVALFDVTFDILEVDGTLSCLVIGLSLLLISMAIDKTEHRAVTPFWYFLGGALFLWASYDFLDDSGVSVFFLGIAAGMLFLSTTLQSRSLLAISTIAILGFIGDFTAEHFVDSVGWPIALIFLGVVLIGLSSLAFRLDRKYIADS